MSEERNSKALLWVGGIAVVGVLLFRKFSPAIIEPLKVKQYVTRIKVQVPAVRFKGDNVEFDVYVQNPNPTPLRIDAIVGDVFVSDAKRGAARLKLGNVTRYGAVMIKPLGETKYTFAVRLKFLSMLSYFNNILQGKMSGQIFTFQGTITINGRPYPITESYKLA